jgi:hypothetical protein
MNYLELAQNKIHWVGFYDSDEPLDYTTGNFLASWVTINWKQNILHHVVG